MATVYLVHQGDAALAREAVVALAAALRARGHEVVGSWTQAGVSGGRVAAFEAAAAAADRVVLIDPAAWWTRSSDDVWQRALRRRLESGVRAQIDSFALVVDRDRAGQAIGGLLAEIPRFVLWQQWPAFLALLARPRVELAALTQAEGLALPRVYVRSERLLETLEGAVTAAVGAGRGFVWIRGAPGSGKSVVLAAWLARRRAAGLPVPCHVARSGLEWTVDLSAVLAKLGLLVLAGVDEPHVRIEREGLERVRGQLAQRSEPLIVAVDGLEQIVFAQVDALAVEPGDLESVHAAWVDALPPGLVLVATSRGLGPGSSGVVPAIDLDVGSALDAQRELVAKLVELAQLGPWTKSLIRVAAGNPGVARALCDDRLVDDRPADPEASPDIPPPKVIAGLERSWTQMLRRVGQPRALRAGLGLLHVAGEPLPHSLLEAALTVGERVALLRHASEWLRIDGDGRSYSLFHEFAARFLDAELDDDDCDPHLRLFAAIDRLRRRGELDDDARAYAERHEREHRLAAYGLRGGVAWVSAVDELEQLAAGGVLESRLAVAHAEADDPSRELIGCILDIVRRHRSTIGSDPGSLAGRLWTGLVSHGLPTSTLTWEPAPPLVRLRNQLRRVDRCYRVLARHGSLPRACAIDAGANRAITVTGDGELHLWSVRSGELLATLELGGWTDNCAITPDGTRCVVGLGQRVSYWDLDARRELDGHDEHGRSVDVVAISEDGRVVLSGDVEGRVFVWHLDQRKRHALGSHGDGVLACAVTPDGRLGMTGGADKRVMFWDLERCTRLHEFSGHSYRVGAVALSASGERAVSICIGEARVWEPRGGVLIETYDDLGMSASGCVIVNGDTEVIAAASGERVFRWTIADGTRTVCHLAHGQDMTGVAATPDGEWYLTIGGDQLARVWQRAATVGLEDEGYVLPINSLRATVDGRGFLIGGGGEGTRRIRVDDGHELARIGSYRSPYGLDERGGRVALVGFEKKVEIYDSATGELSSEWQPSDGWLRACAFDSGGERLAYAGDEKLLFCSSVDGKQLRKMAGHADWILNLAWTPEGRVVCVDDDGELRVWDVDEGTCLRHWKSSHNSRLGALVIEAGGARAFVGGSEGMIEIVELSGQGDAESFARVEGGVSDLASSEDGTVLISVGDDASLRLWDVDGGMELARFDGPFPITRVAVVGRSLVAGDVAGNFLLLDVDWQRLAQSATISR